MCYNLYMLKGTYKHSPEIKYKIGCGNRGKKFGPHTKEHNLKISISGKGLKRKQSTKDKISKNNISFWKGKKLSEEHKKKIREHAKYGKDNPSYKGGITPERNKIRSSIEYEIWKNAVFVRDNWTCQKNKIRGGDLVAHHIKNFAQYPELRFAIDNGITLSKESHVAFHKQYGKINNTKEQLEEFLGYKLV
jgi:hypothetical protein